MKFLFTLLGMSAIILRHIFLGLFAKLFIRDKKALRTYFVNLVTRHSRWALKVIDIELVVDGKENLQEKNYFIAANHLSYLDAVIMSAWRPTTFVTSMEMKNTPLLGTLTELGGCLYVDRKSKENIHNEIGEIEDALADGFSVVIFPEATSTDGGQIKAFKRPLFAAALKSKTAVLPVVIQYEEIDGEKVTAKNRDKLCWYGDMTFGPHFVGLARLRKIKIRLKILPEIPISGIDDRNTLKAMAEKKIMAYYKPII
jgi:1-acyl-sn-glycerol-3-phosphate acyltransferase